MDNKVKKLRCNAYEAYWNCVANPDNSIAYNEYESARTEYLKALAESRAQQSQNLNGATTFIEKTINSKDTTINMNH